MNDSGIDVEHRCQPRAAEWQSHFRVDNHQIEHGVIALYPLQRIILSMQIKIKDTKVYQAITFCAILIRVADQFQLPVKQPNQELTSSYCANLSAQDVFDSLVIIRQGLFDGVNPSLLLELRSNAQTIIWHNFSPGRGCVDVDFIGEPLRFDDGNILYRCLSRAYFCLKPVALKNVKTT